MLNIPEMSEVAANFTAIRLMTEEDIEANNIVNNWKRSKMYLNAEQSRIANEVASPNRLKVNRFNLSYTKKHKQKQQVKFYCNIF